MRAMYDRIVRKAFSSPSPLPRGEIASSAVVVLGFWAGTASFVRAEGPPADDRRDRCGRQHVLESQPSFLENQSPERRCGDGSLPFGATWTGCWSRAFTKTIEVSVDDLPGGTDARGASRVRVMFRVKERPLIRRVDFKGNRKLADSKFRDGLVSKVDEPYDRFKASQDVSKILVGVSRRRLLGRPSRILYVPGPPHQQSDPDVFLTDGRRVTVKDILVEGANALSAKKMRKTLKNTTRQKRCLKKTVTKKTLAPCGSLSQPGILEVTVDIRAGSLPRTGTA
jgi:hypothetical protein